MGHIALYREWRPQTFSDVVAQKQVVFPLKQSIINGEIGHAYLFSGTRGTGKTSTAKIFAKAVNCLHPNNGDPCNECEICKGINDGSLLDVIEIDAASNNSVDNIRRITEEIVFMPTRAKYKVYIIDEVHMLSSGAFNALLKTLEEPPAHAIFILATTEPHRIPATVISRCLRFDFRRIPQQEIIENLKKIAEANALEIEDAALSVIAQLSEGAMRDAISLLDQAKSGITPPITREALFDMIGIVQDQFLLLLFEALLHSDIKEMLHLVQQMVMSGKDLERFITEFAQFLRNILVSKVTGSTDEWFGFTDEDLQKSLQLMDSISAERILQWIEHISKLSSTLKYAGDIRIAIEVGFIRLMNTEQVSETQIAVSSPSISSSQQTPVIKQEEPNSIKKSDVMKEEEIVEPKENSEPEETVQSEELIELESTTDTEQDVIIEESVIIDEPILGTNQETEHHTNSTSETAAVWQEVLAYLSDQHRIDLKMLLSPAVITYANDEWQISFTNDLKSHYKTISKSENKVLIEEALQSITKSSTIKLSVQLTEVEQYKENNLNSAEPAWMKEVRKMAKDLDIPIIMEEQNG